MPFIPMICSNCGEPLQKRIINRIFEKNNISVEFTNIPAYVCDNCGEIVYDIKTAHFIESEMRKKTETAKRKGS